MPGSSRTPGGDRAAQLLRGRRPGQHRARGDPPQRVPAGADQAPAGARAARRRAAAGALAARRHAHARGAAPLRRGAAADRAGRDRRRPAWPVCARASGPVRLAASHSASEAFVAEALAQPTTATQLRRAADRQQPRRARARRRRARRARRRRGRRPGATPNPGVRQVRLADDASSARCPGGIRGRSGGGSRRRSSCARRWSCATRAPTPAGPSTRHSAGSACARLPRCSSAPTPSSARQEALTRNAPLAACPGMCCAASSSSRSRSND